MTHYDGHELHLALCTAFGVEEPRGSLAQSSVREALAEALGRQVPHREYRALTQRGGAPGAMNVVVTWCKAAGIDLMIRYGEPNATFVPRIMLPDGSEYTTFG